jgi:beta-aspartyl-peptidase (threonine type)
MSVVFVHGGVSGTAKEQPPSLRIAFEDLTGGHLDLIESAVRALEDHPDLNAGYGAVLNRHGEIELDAGIADGATGLVGGVANVSVKHPISLARVVLEKTPHVLITGRGAEELGAGMEQLAATTPERIADFERARASGTLDLDSFGAPEHVDTVGAVALDDSGRLAAGSSTGGVFGKMRGRVGDAPIVGAGFYASAFAAVVGTGVGELFLKTSASLRAAQLIEGGAHPQEACERVIEFLGERKDSAAGLLALDRNGRVGAAFRGGSLRVEGFDGILEAVRLD